MKYIAAILIISMVFFFIIYKPENTTVSPKVEQNITDINTCIQMDIASNNETLLILHYNLNLAKAELDSCTRYTHDTGEIKNPQKYDECNRIVENFEKTIELYEEINKELRKALNKAKK